MKQELNQCLDRTVTDNLFLGRYPKKFGIIDEAKMEREANKLFSSLNMNINSKAIMRTMSVSQRQIALPPGQLPFQFGAVDHQCLCVLRG